MSEVYLDPDGQLWLLHIVDFEDGSRDWFLEGETKSIWWPIDLPMPIDEGWEKLGAL